MLISVVMKKNKFIFGITVFAMCIVFFSSCIKEHVTGVMLNEDYLIIPPGSTVTLIATVEPSDASNHNVSWHSDNTEIATVNKKGIVNAITEGNATITTTTKDGNFKATCKIVVDKNAPPPSDYRSKWVGSYDCEEVYKYWQLLSEDSIATIDTSSIEIFQTLINIVTTGDDKLKITENRIGRSYEVRVDKDGSFNESYGHVMSIIFGNFSDNSIDLSINFSGSLIGIQQHSYYKGKKLKNK